jgi:hypothetical protein
MNKKYQGLILLVVGILIIIWGFSGGTIGTFLFPIIGFFLILIGISFIVKMKRWYWIVIILIIAIILYFLLVLFSI